MLGNPQTEISIQVDSVDFSRIEGRADAIAFASSFVDSAKSPSTKFQAIPFPVRKYKLKRASIGSHKLPDFESGLVLRPNSTGIDFEINYPKPVKTMRHIKHASWEPSRTRKLKSKVKQKDFALAINEIPNMSFALINKNLPLKLENPPHSAYRKLKPLNGHKHKSKTAQKMYADNKAFAELPLKYHKDLEITGIGNKFTALESHWRGN